MGNFPTRLEKKPLIQHFLNGGYSKIEFNAKGLPQIQWLKLVKTVLVDVYKLFESKWDCQYQKEGVYYRKLVLIKVIPKISVCQLNDSIFASQIINEVKDN